VPKKRPPKAQISTLADRQLGHVTRGQLLEIGVAPSWIRSQVRASRLIPVHGGVYAVGHVPRHAHGRAVAAVLACGAGAVLSHAAAAALWEVGEWPARLEVSAPRERRRPGIRTHRSSTLSAHEARVRHGVPVTSPVRTVIDLQRRLTDPRLIRLVNELRVAGHLGPSAFTELCARSGRVERLLGDGELLTRSELEDLFRRFVTRHRLPMPELNVELPGGREVDALYRDARLIVEVDSWRFHRDRASFERDRAKDARALAEDYRTLRTTDRRLTRGGAEEARTIRRILGVA
jgi:very-short-patch-repair endonuclease